MEDKPSSTPISREGVFGGFLGTLVGLGGKAACPNCGHQLSKIPAFIAVTRKPFVLCESCGKYHEIKKEHLVAVSHDTVSEEACFAMDVPWNDLDRCTVAPLLGGPARVFPKHESRLVPAVWPQKCCICGSTTTTAETVSITLQKHGGFRSLFINICLKDVPYCEEHKSGLFGRKGGQAAGVTFPSLCEYDCRSRDSFRATNSWPIIFRSYRYYNEFREANHWTG
jgi:hypothetical protein